MAQFTEFDISRNAADLVSPLLDDAREACNDRIADLRSKLGWSDSDWRIVAIHRLRNVIQSTLALRIFEWVIFPNDNFWKAFFQGVPSRSCMEDHFRELDMMARFAAFHGMFSALEADVRELVRRLDQTACNGGKANFEGVMGWLLARLPGVASYTEFVELIRLTRNTIHNNGVHRPTRMVNATVNYKGRQFAFSVDRPIDFCGWNFVAFVALEILGLLEALVTDQKVIALHAG